MGMKCIKSAARVLDIDYVNTRDLYLSKEVLWASVCQRAEVLQAVKVRGQKKKIQPTGPVRTRLIGRIFFYLQL